MVLEDLVGCAGTVLYGACEAEFDGESVPFGNEYKEAGGVTFHMR